MTDTWLIASLWLGLALVASLLSIWLRIATALSEIVVGAIAQLLIGAFVGSVALGVAGRRHRPDGTSQHHGKKRG